MLDSNKYIGLKPLKAINKFILNKFRQNDILAINVFKKNSPVLISYLIFTIRL